MKRIIFRSILIIIVFLQFSCEKEVITPDTKIDNAPLVYVENDYLVFKNKVVYDSILALSETWDDDLKDTWAGALGFTSASKVYRNAESEIRTSIEAGDLDLSPIIEKYKGQLEISNSEMSYLFYPRTITDLLNIQGIVKIGQSLYKFTKDKEYVITDGDHAKLDLIKEGTLKAATNLEDLSIYAFDPYESSALKTTVIIADGTHTDGRYRFHYLAEKITYLSFNGFNPYTMKDMWSYGYSFKLYIESQKKTLFWFGYKTRIYVKNQHLIRTLNGDYRDNYYSDLSAYTKNLAVPYLSFNFDFVVNWGAPPGYSVPYLNIHLYYALIHTTKISASDGKIIDYP